MTAAAFKSIVFLVSLVSGFIGERIWPADVQRADFNRLGRNVSLAFVNFLLGPLLVLPITAYAAAHGLGFRPTWWNVALDLLLLDLWIYGWHRINHIVPILWRFHQVHHRDEQLDSTSALRFHFGEVALSAMVRGVVIWLMAIPFNTVVVFEALVIAAAIFQHSNLRLPLRFESWLAHLIVTPGLHWVHHHALREDTDSNYATVLSIWDVIFGSRSANKRKPQMKLGVEGQVELPLLKLLLLPFARANRAP